MSEKGEPVCTKCRFFTVTWDEVFPRACEIYGFSARQFPSQVVYEESGTHCQAFEARSTKPAEPDSPPEPGRRRIKLGRLVH